MDLKTIRTRGRIMGMTDFKAEGVSSSTITGFFGYSFGYGFGFSVYIRAGGEEYGKKPAARK